MKPIIALLMLVAAMFVGACNSQPGASGVPTLDPLTSPDAFPTTSPEVLPTDTLPSESPAS